MAEQLKCITRYIERRIDINIQSFSGNTYRKNQKTKLRDICGRHMLKCMMLIQTQAYFVYDIPQVRFH
jgi:hypothetical protein